MVRWPRLRPTLWRTWIRVWSINREEHFHEDGWFQHVDRKITTQDFVGMFGGYLNDVSSGTNITLHLCLNGTRNRSEIIRAARKCEKSPNREKEDTRWWFRTRRGYTIVCRGKDCYRIYGFRKEDDGNKKNALRLMKVLKELYVLIGYKIDPPS